MKKSKWLLLTLFLCCMIQGALAEENWSDNVRKDLIREWVVTRNPMLIRSSRFADSKFPYFPGFEDYPRAFSEGMVVKGRGYISYEVDMTDYSLYSYVTEENIQRFSATGDSIYLRNVVKYVKYVPDNNENNSRYYIVTYIPTDDVAESVTRCKNEGCLSANKHLTGIVIKYDLEGIFCGDFVYKEGKQIREIAKNKVGEKLRLKRVQRKREINGGGKVI